MDVFKAIKKRRSIRQFKQEKIPLDVLNALVDAGRIAPSAANLQPIEYIVVNDDKICNEIFSTIGWAGYLKDWQPSEDVQPVAYILLIAKKPKNDWYVRDASFAAENIVLAAESHGVGSCILLNFDKQKIVDILDISKDYVVDCLIALGYKAESCVAEDLKDSVEYWRDEQGVLHVPKRKFEDVYHLNGF